MHCTHFALTYNIAMLLSTTVSCELIIYIKFYSMKVARVQCDCISSPFPTHVSQGGHCFSTSLQVQLYLAKFHQQNANVGVERGVIESANRHDILLQAYKSATIYSTIILLFLYYNSP